MNDRKLVLSALEWKTWKEKEKRKPAVNRNYDDDDKEQQKSQE